MRIRRWSPSNMVGRRRRGPACVELHVRLGTEGAENLPLDTRRRRWPRLVAAGVAAAVVGAVVVTALVRRGDDGDSTEQLPPCQVDDNWTSIELTGDPTREVTDDLETVEFEAVSAVYQLDGTGGAEIVLEVAGTNHSEPRPDVTDDGGAYLRDRMARWDRGGRCRAIRRSLLGARRRRPTTTTRTDGDRHDGLPQRYRSNWQRGRP